MILCQRTNFANARRFLAGRFFLMIERGPKKDEVSHQLNRSITLPTHELPPTVTSDTQLTQEIFGNICRETYRRRLPSGIRPLKWKKDGLFLPIRS